MKFLLRCLGVIWASPMTLLGLLYALLFAACGLYRFHGIHQFGLVWVIKDSAPASFKRAWEGWAGHTVGQVIILREDPTATEKFKTKLEHELVHVDQFFCLGCLFFPAYFACYFVSCLGVLFGVYKPRTLKGVYRNNIFERHARRVSHDI